MTTRPFTDLTDVTLADEDSNSILTFDVNRAKRKKKKRVQLGHCAGANKSHFENGNPVFKYEKIELLVCIYEISGELVFKYGISRCSRWLTVVT